jgi:hypothetical protein
LPSHHSFERCDPGFVFLEQVGRLHVIIQGSGFELADPDPDQLTRNVVALGQRWSVSPAMNSSATCRLNATLWERCLAMASILQKPGKGGQIYQLKLSTRGGALQLSGNYSTLIDILSRDLSSQAMRVRHLGDWIASMVTVGDSGEPTLSKQGVEASVTGSPA